MVKISKQEAKKLRAMGVYDGKNGISHTYTHHPHYYLCESVQNMQMLAQIRK